jgi:alkenylglycerophosphocholine hydrolase
VSSALVGLVIALGATHLAAYYGGRRVVAGIVKGLPVLILAWVVSHAPTADARFAGLVATGLVFSAIGDVSLVFAGGFLAGLASFLVAHCFYIGAFAAGAAASPVALATALALAAVSAAMLGYLWPHVARVRVAVVVYVAALATMMWCAVARALAGAPGGALAAAGAAIFLVSDGVLATDRFARRFAGAHGVVMVTYYAAQLLIASSALA